MFKTKILRETVTEVSRTGRSLLIVLFLALIVTSIVPVWLSLHHQNVRIYAEPTDLRYDISDDGTTLQFVAVSSKLQNCEVITNSAVYLLAHVATKKFTQTGRILLKSVVYPPVRYDGTLEEGNPIIRSGESFLVGPWQIKDDPEVIKNIHTVDVILECRFPSSGVTRTAKIGPMYFTYINHSL